MKKVIFSMYDMNIGGIENALLNILNNFNYNKYDVSVLLEKKSGIFLDLIPSNVKIIDYNLCDSKNIIYRKIKNRIKLILFSIKNYKKYDFGICYASHRRVGSVLIPIISKKNAIWIHGNYYEENDSDFSKFYNYFNIKKYNNVVFVSNALKSKFIKYNKTKTNQTLRSFNNMIDYKNIISKSKEEKLKKNKTTFISVGRLTEEEKNLSMLIEVCKKLYDEKYDFDLLIIGDGIDKHNYVELVNKYHLEKKIKFLGSKKNPYPYFKIADALLLTSKKEGNPVVFLESKVLNVPIITTDVSDAKDDIDSKYGLVSENNFNDYYNTLKTFLDEGFKITKKFDPKEYNLKILNEIYSIIEEEN